MAVDFVTEEESDWSRDDWGVLVERAACETYRARHVATDDSTPDWIDAIVQEDVVDDGYLVVEKGTALQAKGTVWRSREYRSRLDDFTTRRGRYFVRRHAHEALLEDDGAYVLGVYDPALGAANPIDLALVDAREVDRIGLTWCSNGDGLEAARLGWSEVFDPDAIETRRDELAAEVASS